MSDLPRITLVTGNKGKLSEVRAILDGIAVVDNHAIDLPELQGTTTAIVTEKAKAAFHRLRQPVMIEDTSLGFNALGGLPGPYIKWFLESVKQEGLVKMLQGFDDKGAVAKCVFAYATGPNDSDVTIFEGECRGTVVAPVGSGGFGWDPIFHPDGEAEGVTFASMSKEEKNKISHRARALQKVKEHFAATTEGERKAAPPGKKLRSESI